ncbi:alpha/beta hydrolase [Lacimicrobium alkaliphilum]|uniref:Esterase n=1 Tax=Lacimicrobium alkaliphilum TaxID=1526571 RepID=A0A0U2JIT2_9ALTE|nr:alpha/beta hydrolase-fold protein [Lacimicrobium alkaliphilum]ALS98246.1 esterase [Lacimicrobium alkaliphilum]
MRVLVLCAFLLLSYAVSASDLILARQVTLESKSLGEERELLIRLPDGYAPEKATYPVLYLLHGQWDMLPALSTLDLLADEIPDFIVVGIQSKGPELKPVKGEFTPFTRFLTQELVPYIKQHYATAPFSILSGHSNSGRFVMDRWLANDPQFSQFYAFSPSLDDGYIVERVMETSPESLPNRAPLVITIASEGEHMQAPFDKLAQTLEQQPELDFSFQKFPEQSHRTTKHPSMQFALQTTFKGWEPSYETKVGGLDGLTSHYSNLSKQFGFRVDVPTETLQKLTAYYAISEDKDAVDSLNQIISFTLKQSETGSDALFEIADYLSANGYEEAGESVLKGICSEANELIKRCGS